MSHPIVHVEISAKDHKAAGKFYSTVFGWKTEEFPDMNYTTFEGPEHSVGGGFNPVNDDNPAGTIMVYIDTDNLEETLKAIEANGGKIVMPYLNIPTVGDMAIFQDPTGNTLALLKPLEGM